MNWVFCKSDILAWIYGDNSSKYEDTIASLPADMQKKRLLPVTAMIEQMTRFQNLNIVISESH